MRRIATTALVIAATATLAAGCARPGTAAMVDGERITDEQVATLSADMERLQGVAPASSEIMSSLITVGPVLEVAEEAGIGVTDQQGIELLDSVVTSGGGEPWDYSDELIDIARLSYISQSLDAETNELINQRLLDIEADVNPRYGSWDPSLGVVPTTWPWLETAEASLAG